MNRSEQLIDNYEDALFAVLMDKVAGEEGARLREENQRLQDDPAAEVPEHVDAVARQTIRKAFAGQNRRSALHVANRVLNTVAMIVLICSAIFATAYAAFPEVRVKTLNLLIQSSDVASRLVLLNEDDKSNRTSENNEDTLLCGYLLPTIEGFTVVEHNEDNHGGWICFEGTRGETIRVDIAQSAIHYVDIENASVIDDYEIHGYSGMIIEKDNHITITWLDRSQSMNIAVVCTNLNQSYALHVAEQIIYTGM